MRGASEPTGLSGHLLIERLHPLVLKLVRSHRPPRTAEEDLAQTIFARIFHRLEQYSDAVPLEHWVSRIAINTCLNQIESERVGPELRHADLCEAQAAVVELVSFSETEVSDSHATAARARVRLRMVFISDGG